MRWKMAAGICALATGLAVSAPAQERLQDVAGSMRLKQDVREDVIIQPQSSGRSGASQSEGSILKLIVEEGLSESREFLALLEELVEDYLFADDGWRGRIGEVSLGLDMVQQDLMGTVHSVRYSAAYELAGQGIGGSVESSVVVREGIAGNRLRITEPREQLEESIQLLEKALWMIESVLRQEDRESTPAPIDPVTAAETIRGYCGGKHSEGSQPYADCVSRQNAAYNSCFMRSPFGVGLEEAEFNSVRNGCRYEWPDDFGSQNRCEIDRMEREVRR